ncbi:flagellar filament capping protein FliD [Candidatus Haliotispira prima]|uniref:Flagellar hook-associated protein 2 n=1 Tax=Candidatus Haliotispira prima TaxID=3034016 RepID=A0ABY8ME56_9SPIO|nr:flagellar filament capping protein FliD [Candidatus Haliotispira prima]
MPDISIPGVTESKYKTEAIVAGLVKTKEVQLDRMQEGRSSFESKRDVWQSINILTNKLEGDARSLYNVDNPFRQKLSSVSNESVLTVSNDRQVENGEYTVRIMQVATADRLRSDEIANDFLVPDGKYTFGSGKDDKSFTFNGGSLKQFVTMANRQLDGLAQFNVINSRAGKQVLVFHSANSGIQNRLRFADQGKELALKVGLILDATSLRVDLLEESLISPFNKLSDYNFSESKNEVSIGPGQELRISLPNSYTVRPGSVMRYDISAPKDHLPPISNTPDNSASQAVPAAPQLQPSVNQGNFADFTDFENDNHSRFSGRDVSDIPPPPSAELDDIRIDSVGSDTALIGIDPGSKAKEEGPPLRGRVEDASNTESAPKVPQAPPAQARQQSDADLLNPTANLYLVQQNRRVPAGPKEGEVQASTLPHEEILSLSSIDKLRNVNEVVIRNPNPDREIIIRDLRFEDAEIKNDYLLNHPVSTAGNARISYLGVEIERPANNVDDLLPGLTLNLKRAKPDEDIIIRTQPDYNTITEKVAEFVTSYNNLMTQLNVVSSNNDTVIREKTSFTEKQEEEAREVLGLMRGDSNITGLKFRMTQSVSDGYPTELGTRIFSDIGISTNLSGSQNGIDQSKLRGYLEFDTEIFLQAMEDNFRMVQDLFGRDNDGDYTVDSGGALEVQRISNAYTQPNGPIPYRVQDLERRIEDSDRRIADYRDYLKDYETDLKRKYGRMEGALNQLGQQQQSLENFSNAMNSK